LQQTNLTLRFFDFFKSLIRHSNTGLRIVRIQNFVSFEYWSSYRSNAELRVVRILVFVSFECRTSCRSVLQAPKIISNSLIDFSLLACLVCYKIISWVKLDKDVGIFPEPSILLALVSQLLTLASRILTLSQAFIALLPTVTLLFFDVNSLFITLYSSFFYLISSLFQLLLSLLASFISLFTYNSLLF